MASYGVDLKWVGREDEEIIGSEPKGKYNVFFESEKELKDTLVSRFKIMLCKRCNSMQVVGHVALKVKELRLCHEDIRKGFWGDKIVKTVDRKVFSLVEGDGCKIKCNNCNNSFSTDGWDKMPIIDGMRLYNNYFGMLFNEFVPKD